VENGGEEGEWGRKNRARGRGSSKASEARGKRDRGIVGAGLGPGGFQLRGRSGASVGRRGS